ncbi:MAG TPA: LysM peptidoglycan-binding domain-containing protein [Nevskiaceae bacterium]|nr:LysM peptidoglycan-binding domain-containing protein [Nevskiaceae bacterium]
MNDLPPRTAILVALAAVLLAACSGLPHRLHSRAASPAPAADLAASTPSSAAPASEAPASMDSGSATVAVPSPAVSKAAATRAPLPVLPQLPPRKAQRPLGSTANLMALPPLPGSSPAPAAPTPSASHAPPARPTPAAAQTTNRARAEQALRDIGQRANLTQDQQRRAQHARAVLAGGNAKLAAELAVGLDAEVRTASRAYTVKPGDTLGGIAQQIYGNSDLWPLIWRANRKVIAKPARLRGGMKLQIHPYPTLDQAAAALAYAHRHAS